MGAFSAAQTLAMAGGAATMGAVLDRLGIWRAIVAGVSVFLVASLGLALAEAASAAAGAVGGLRASVSAYVFTSTMPFIIAWARHSERQYVSTLALLGRVAVDHDGVAAGRVSARRSPRPGRRDLPIDAHRRHRASPPLGSCRCFAWGRPAEAGDCPIRPRPRKRRNPTSGGRCAGTSSVFVLVGGLMAVGAGMVIPFYNVYLTTLGADATLVGYIYAVGGLSAAPHRAAGPDRFAAPGFDLGRGGGPLVGRAVLSGADPSAGVAAGGGGAHRAADEHLDGLADRLDLHRRRAAAAGAGRGSTGCGRRRGISGYSGASLLAGVLIVRVGYEVTFLDLIVFTVVAMVDLRRLLQPTPTGALRGAPRSPAALAANAARPGRPGGTFPVMRRTGLRLSRRRSAAVVGMATTPLVARCPGT